MRGNLPQFLPLITDVPMPCLLLSICPLAPPCLWHHPQIRFAKGVASEASEHPQRRVRGAGACPWGIQLHGMPVLEVPPLWKEFPEWIYDCRAFSPVLASPKREDLPCPAWWWGRVKPCQPLLCLLKCLVCKGLIEHP